MKYSELFERIYDSTNTGDEFLLTQDFATRASWSILFGLNDRGGFDHWWDDIDDDLHDEIFDEMRGRLVKQQPTNRTE